MRKPHESVLFKTTKIDTSVRVDRNYMRFEPGMSMNTTAHAKEKIKKKKAKKRCCFKQQYVALDEDRNCNELIQRCRDPAGLAGKGMEDHCGCCASSFHLRLLSG